MKYTVHAKAIVNVTLMPIEAASQQEALKKAEEMVLKKMGEGLIDYRDQRDPDIKYIESGEDIECYLVDEDGDEEYKKSEWYTRNHQVMKANACERCNAEPAKA